MVTRDYRDIPHKNNLFPLHYSCRIEILNHVTATKNTICEGKTYEYMCNIGKSQHIGKVI